MRKNGKTLQDTLKMQHSEISILAQIVIMFRQDFDNCLIGNNWGEII